MLFATIAISIDAMLPALDEIGRTLSPDAPNLAQLVVTAFVFGMGLGTLFAGPLSDTFGRKPVILAGAALYCLAAVACWAAPSKSIPLSRYIPLLAPSGWCPRSLSSLAPPGSSQKPKPWGFAAIRPTIR